MNTDRDLSDVRSLVNILLGDTTSALSAVRSHIKGYRVSLVHLTELVRRLHIKVERFQRKLEDLACDEDVSLPLSPVPCDDAANANKSKIKVPHLHSTIDKADEDFLAHGRFSEEVKPLLKDIVRLGNARLDGFLIHGDLRNLEIVFTFCDR